MIFHLQADFPKQSKWLGQSQEFHPGFPHELEELADLATCAASPGHQQGMVYDAEQQDMVQCPHVMLAMQAMAFPTKSQQQHLQETL